MRANCTPAIIRGSLAGIEQLENRLLLSVVPPAVTNVAVSSSGWSEEFFDYLQSAGLGTDGYSIPVGSSNQLQALPWIDLDRVTISFSEDVHIDANDLSISGVVNTNYSIDHFFYNPQTRTAAWTLETPIAAGELIQLDLDGDGSDPVRDLEGNILDGEWVNQASTYASGNGAAGGDFEFRFNVLEGDTVANNLINYFDYLYTRMADGYEIGESGYNPFYDVDGSGAINATDWQEVLARLWATLPSGTPPGVLNDAPTAGGYDLVQISDRDANIAISLHDIFDDSEDADSELVYSITAITSADLFDTYSINQQTGLLTLNAAGTSGGAQSTLPSGRSTITITAVDTSGLSVSATVTVDVDYENQPPVITDYLGVCLSDDLWAISGTVTDSDDEVEGLIVELSGVFEARVAVNADGKFYVTVSLGSNVFGWESAVVADLHGGLSNKPDIYIGLT